MNQNNAGNNTDPVDCIANGTISIKVLNVDALDDVEGRAQQISSEVHKIGGLKWQMKVRNLLNPSRLNLYIYCNETVKERLWLCKVQLTMKMWATGEEDKPFYSKSGHFYGFNSHFWIFPIELYNRFRPLKKNHPIEIQLEIKLGQVQEKSLPTLDTSLVLNMGEGHSETLFVNKHILAGLSSYFRNLFFEDLSNRREHGGNVFELNEPADFDIRAFKAMIYSAMTLGSCRMIQEANFLDYELAVEIVKQSVKFDFPMLQDGCEQYLIDSRACDYSAMDLLGLADQFNLVQLKASCLENVSVRAVLTRFDYVDRGFSPSNFDKSKKIFLRLSKATQEQLRTKLEENVDNFEIRPGLTNMTLLEVADHFNLVQLKQQCLERLSVLDYMTNFSLNHAIHTRLSKPTQEQLQTILDGKAEELWELAEQLKSGVESNKSKRVLVGHINKLNEALLGNDEELSSDEE